VGTASFESPINIPIRQCFYFRRVSEDLKGIVCLRRILTSDSVGRSRRFGTFVTKDSIDTGVLKLSLH
jgi:hypothetical protein